MGVLLVSQMDPEQNSDIGAHQEETELQQYRMLLLAQVYAIRACRMDNANEDKNKDSYFIKQLRCTKST